MAGRVAGQIHEIGGQVERLAGAELSGRVLQGSEQAAVSTDPQQVALWLKGAMERLDTLADEATRREIMRACGHTCISINPRPLEAARSRRRKYPSEQAFLEAELKKPPRGFRFERKGNLLVQYYTPLSFGAGVRCFCGLMRGLPQGKTVSRTFCMYSRGFVEKYWEGTLGRPVEVELKETALSGSEVFSFLIHL